MKSGICGKIPEPKIIKAKDFELTDVLDQKGMYEISKIKGLKPIEAIKIIEKFSDKIDVEFLIDNPDRIDSTLDIIESICDYIDNNIDILKKLDKEKLDDLIFAFDTIRKNFNKLTIDPNILGEQKEYIKYLNNNNILKTIYKLKPNLIPKK